MSAAAVAPAASASSSSSLPVIDRVRAAALAGEFESVSALLVDHSDLCSVPNAIDALSRIELPDFGKFTCLHAVASHYSDVTREDRATLMMLFLSDLKVDATTVRDSARKTPLHRAAHGGFDDLVELLVDADSSALTIGDLYEDTPLHVAILQRNLSTIKLLIELATKAGKRRELLSSKNQNGHLLHFALDFGPRVFQCIFECLTDEERQEFCALKNEYDRTVLHSALTKQAERVAIIMLEGGIPVNMDELCDYSKGVLEYIEKDRAASSCASSSAKRPREASSSSDRSTKSRND